jgi:predicted MFS family arabinose efflux permease
MMLGVFLLVSVYMQDVLGMTAVAAGAGLLAVRATQTVVAPLGARAARALGARPLMVAGMLGMTAGVALLARAPASGAYARDLLPGLLVLGVAIPLLFLTVSMAALDAAGDDHAGLASGLLNTCQWVGGAVGIALASAVAAAREGAPAGGVQAGLWACAALGLIGTALALALPRGGGALAPSPAPLPAAR